MLSLLRNSQCTLQVVSMRNFSERGHTGSLKCDVHWCSSEVARPIYYRPQRNWGKVIFSQVSVILSGWGGIPACLAGGIPACLAAGLQGGGGIPACLAGFQAHTQGKFREIWPGGSPGPHPRGKFRGIWSGLSPRSHPGGVCFRGGGSLLPGGACFWGVPGPWGGVCGDPPGHLLLRAVRILLEYILVFYLSAPTHRVPYNPVFSKSFASNKSQV